MKSTCLIEGCDKPYYGRGWCNMHWQRWRKWGDPLKTVLAPAGSGTIDHRGYRRIYDDQGRQVFEHRVVAAKTLGRPLLSEEEVHHRNEIKTDNRPENLVVYANHAEHALQHCSRNECKRGHPATEENSYWYRGYRTCRECRRERCRKPRKS